MHLFLGKRIIILSPAVHIKLSTAVHVQSPHVLLSPSNLLLLPFTVCCVAPTSHSIADEADQILRIVDELIIDESKSDCEMGSDVPVASSSNVAAAKMADKTTPEMIDYWKKKTVTEAGRQAYHSFGWLNGGLESSVPTVKYLTVDDTIVVCFESHLYCWAWTPA
jgi:hypothetical protein